MENLTVLKPQHDELCHSQKHNHVIILQHDYAGEFHTNVGTANEWAIKGQVSASILLIKSDINGFQWPK